jgi:RNA polymerase sigma-70 factor (ECF subfamily)
VTTYSLTDTEHASMYEADRPAKLSEDEFRAFYDATARPVWAFLVRLTGEGRRADDLLQETYYRFLRVNRRFDSDAHRRNYLFRIAANLAHEERRRPQHEDASAAELESTLPSGVNSAERLARRIDLTRMLAQLNTRERTLLWLAYAEGASHEEIAQTLRVKTASLKVLLYRARRHAVSLLNSVIHRESER